ncbi:DnaJ domain-containing protein [Candidatus Poribacteria bacterium]|nr:DnaJ domain-containing protein [Candidatus Poribacteria bacterium]MBT5536562.1 DnaJ domain-containing protein [Candidatus Poribacteria bacterium]MBT7098337.1 DnaJ domain-containing protein [Candidatus Poribacteria bacterium]MBT7804496.1 DnaJ domain-containing protein [Candidatus Poribacteria bacterium]
MGKGVSVHAGRDIRVPADARGKTIAHGQTHYERLQVAPDACVEVIRAAARALLKRRHPDKNPARREWAEAQARLINESVAALCDPTARDAYDASLPDISAAEPTLSREERFFHQAYANHLQGRYGEAMRAYEQCLISNPRNAAAHYNLGCIYEAQGNVRTAQHAYHAAQVVSPGYRDAAARSAELARSRFASRIVHTPLETARA